MISCLAAAGFAKMFFILIKPDELLGGWVSWLNWNKFLMKIEPKKGKKHFYIKDLIYKRFGGCIICTRQQFNDFAFIWLMIIVWYTPATFPTSYLPTLWLEIPCFIVMYGGFSATSLLIGQWLEYEKRQADTEKIIETRYD